MSAQAAEDADMPPLADAPPMQQPAEESKQPEQPKEEDEASDEDADQAPARLTPPSPAPEMTLDEAMAEIRRLQAENQRLSAELARQRA